MATGNDSYWLIFSIVNMIIFGLILIPEFKKLIESRQELKMHEQMKKELGENPSKEQFKAFIERNKKQEKILKRLFFKMEMFNKSQELFDSLVALLKKMKEDMDE